MKKKIFIKKKSLNKEFNMNTQESLRNYSLIHKALTKDKKVKIIYKKDLIKPQLNIFDITFHLVYKIIIFIYLYKLKKILFLFFLLKRYVIPFNLKNL